MELVTFIHKSVINGPDLKNLIKTFGFLPKVDSGKLETNYDGNAAKLAELQQQLLEAQAEENAVAARAPHIIKAAREYVLSIQQEIANQEQVSAQVSTNGAKMQKPASFAVADKMRAAAVVQRDAWRDRAAFKAEAVKLETLTALKAIEDAQAALKSQHDNLIAQHATHATTWQDANAEVEASWAAKIIELEGYCKETRVLGPAQKASSLEGLQQQVAQLVAQLALQAEELASLRMQALSAASITATTAQPSKMPALEQAQEERMHCQQQLLEPLVAGPLSEAEQEARSSLRDYHKESLEQEDGLGKGKGVGKGAGGHY
jgi:hypothetical protein